MSQVKWWRIELMSSKSSRVLMLWYLSGRSSTNPIMKHFFTPLLRYLLCNLVFLFCFFFWGDFCKDFFLSFFSSGSWIVSMTLTEPRPPSAKDQKYDYWREVQFSRLNSKNCLFANFNWILMPPTFLFNIFNLFNNNNWILMSPISAIFSYNWY